MTRTKTHLETVEKIKKGTVKGQTKLTVPREPVRRLAKTHQDYWFSRLRKRGYLDRAGQFVEIPNWQVRLKHGKKESWFNLGTPNQAAAAKKAKEIYTFVEANGMDAATAKFKPQMEPSKSGCTVGEFLEQVKAVSGLKPVTYEIYASKFRSLVSGVFKVHSGVSKHDYVNGGNQKWLERVHSVRLHKLTPDQVNRWKVRVLKDASKSPIGLKRKSVTVRSVLLCSKALFSADIRKHLTLSLPSPLPFDGVTLPDAGKSRYKSEIDPALILTAAKRELADGNIALDGENKLIDPRPELFKIVLLALGAGLRRDEIDKLQWKQILWHKNALRIETTEHGSTKSADSEAEVDVDPGLLDILKTYMPKPGKGSSFVIESPVKPNPAAVKNHHYRCARLFKEAIGWLRGKGMTARNAIHSLRKEFGSQICAQAGIFAASTALRHSSINLTREYYIDKKQPTFLAISKLIQPEVAHKLPDSAKAAAA